MHTRQPVFNESNCDLVLLAAMGTFVTWLFGPLWVTAIVAFIMFGTIYLFYKNERERLDSQVNVQMAMIFDAKGQFVGFTTYRVR